MDSTRRQAIAATLLLVAEIVRDESLDIQRSIFASVLSFIYCQYRTTQAKIV